MAFVLLLIMLAQAQPPPANYDESKVGDYTLPDPLTFTSGGRVETAEQWRRKRRPEILEMFASQMFGHTPRPRRIEYEVTSRQLDALGGLATRKEVTIWTAGRKAPALHLLVYIPNDARKPVPAFLGPNFRGNHAIHSDPGITLNANWMRPAPGVVDNRATEESRASARTRWPVETILRSGYALATYYYGDVFPDHKDGLKDSIIPHLYRPGQTAQDPGDWNAIGAWAYGLSRALDYLEKETAIDAKQVAVIGHSRLGKTALWAGAQDERFAMVISNNSGEGGAALSRRNYGETVKVLNTAFPHWFAGNYKQYSDRVSDLPFDQHMLIALIAPRPVYIASAEEDRWADPKGEFLSGVAAGPVYRLLGAQGLGVTEMPGLHEPVGNRIGYHIRAGKHDVTDYDWEQFIAFANKHFTRR